MNSSALLKGALKYAIGFGLLAFVIARNWDGKVAPNGNAIPGLKDLLNQTPDVLALVLTAVFLVVATSLQFVRWYMLVRALDLPFTPRNAFRLGMVGYFYNTFLPGSVGGDLMSDRMKLATLAYYYAVADPDTSMLMMNGGNEPASEWRRHWTDAVKYNVGRPVGEYSVFAQGADPSNAALVYKVYQRRYQNALVLYKPLSYTKGTTGTTADATATTHALDGYYRPLKNDGTLGAAVNRITLRNGEGAILVKV